MEQTPRKNRRSKNRNRWSMGEDMMQGGNQSHQQHQQQQQQYHNQQYQQQKQYQQQHHQRGDQSDPNSRFRDKKPPRPDLRRYESPAARRYSLDPTQNGFAPPDHQRRFESPGGRRNSLGPRQDGYGSRNHSPVREWVNRSHAGSRNQSPASIRGSSRNTSPASRGGSRHASPKGRRYQGRNSGQGRGGGSKQHQRRNSGQQGGGSRPQSPMHHRRHSGSRPQSPRRQGSRPGSRQQSPQGMQGHQHQQGHQRRYSGSRSNSRPQSPSGPPNAWRQGGPWSRARSPVSPRHSNPSNPSSPMSPMSPVNGPNLRLPTSPTGSDNKPLQPRSPVSGPNQSGSRNHSPVGRGRGSRHQSPVVGPSPIVNIANNLQDKPIGRGRGSRNSSPQTLSTSRGGSPVSVGRGSRSGSPNILPISRGLGTGSRQQSPVNPISRGRGSRPGSRNQSPAPGTDTFPDTNLPAKPVSPNVQNESRGPPVFKSGPPSPGMRRNSTESALHTKYATLPGRRPQHIENNPPRRNSYQFESSPAKPPTHYDRVSNSVSITLSNTPSNGWDRLPVTTVYHRSPQNQNNQSDANQNPATAQNNAYSSQNGDINANSVSKTMDSNKNLNRNSVNEVTIESLNRNIQKLVENVNCDSPQNLSQGSSGHMSVDSSDQSNVSVCGLTDNARTDSSTDNSGSTKDSDWATMTDTNLNTQQYYNEIISFDSGSDDEGKDTKRKNRRQQLKDLDKNKKGGSDMDAFLSDEVAPEPVVEQPAVVNHTEEKRESTPVSTVSSADSKPEETPAPPTTIDEPDNKEKEVAEISPEKEVEKEAEVTKEVAEEQLSTDNKVAAENEKNKEKLNLEEKTSVSEERELTPENDDSEIPVIQEDSKSVLRYNYPEDQWSPINLEGKKQYDRDFLLQLQFSNESLEKPDGLPKLPDVILDKPINRHQESRHSTSSFRSNASSVDFTPGFFKPMQGGGGGAGGKSGSMSRRSQQKDKGGQPRKVISVSLQQDIKLHHTENAWKPSTAAKGPAAAAPAGADPAKSKTEEILKKVRSILNKLTPQKFQTLVQQILSLDINTEERLKGVIDLVFEKAIDEPGFSVAYAQLCKQLSNVKVPTDGDGKDASFRNLLLNRCQKEFENYSREEDWVKEKEAAMEKTATDAEKKKLKEELDGVLSKAKRRSLGNIRFIGELFKLQMLTETIMHQCILKLLKSADEDSYECFCRLLATIGKDIDQEKAKVRMDQYFQQIEKIIKQKRTSSRVRFMLQDVYDLRKNRWIPRRADNAPKTIDQIHKEVQLEDQQRAQMLANMPPAPRGGGGGNRRGGGRQGNQGQQGEDGWQITKSTYRSNNIDPQKMRLTKHLDEDIKLGPGGRPGFTGWGRGSSGGGKTSSQEGERPSTPANRFSALGSQSTASDSSRTSGRGQTPSRDSKSRTTTPRPQSKYGARASQEQDRESALSAVRHSANRSLVGGQQQRTPTGSRNQSRDSSRSRDLDRDAEAMPPPSGPPSGPAVKGLSDAEMEKKTIAVMDEYLHINDLKEALLCIKELESPRNMHLFVYNAINHVLERSPQARKLTGSLLHDVVKQGVISVQTYTQGLLEVLEFAEDMEVDIPKIWTYLGELLGPMVQDGSVPLSFLKDVAEPLKSCNKAGVLVAEVLHAAATNIGNIKVGEMWRKSLLEWSDFINPAEVSDFVKKHKLEFTVGAEEPRSPDAKSLTLDQIMTRLEDLIIRRREINENVFDWIEGNIGEPKSKEAPFIRALMTVVCRSAIVGEETRDIKMVPEVITTRSILLQKYLDHNGELELQALYALQALVHKLDHPAGLLRRFFDHLYDEDIISEDAFNQWDSSNDQAESAGKGVAKQSVLQFFIWLREAEDESQDDS